MADRPMVRGRFAPSPSGRMHLGNVWSCLLAWLSARSAGGGMVLRLEDLDPDRCKMEYCDQVMRDLEWLGLDWDGQPMYQSRRTEAYAEAFRSLERQGLVYPCYCTRAERLAVSAPHRSDGGTVYDGRCRRLSPGEREALARTRRPAWRVQVPEKTITFRDLLQGEYKEELHRDCGDFILRRSDGVYAYQLAVVVDDGAMGVTQVVRGSDLLDSTPRQLWLQEVLGLPHPAYGHVPLLLAPDGRRLAKRDRDLELGQLRETYTAPELVGRLAFAAGLLPEYAPVTPRELLPLFNWDRVPRGDMVCFLPADGNGPEI
ncbi:tRNA glutamyl-Q(34) synthetase GluQRS [Pseudoflavonifractor phocaeensis]|uniref:tRNA glutamyl-Q(34) synthetase GluQRS n=1 Tax=Pseudoflavonifractor phocaeensis TaxID=1870988 RepID=UPI001F1C5898|nr:tRNA glutamyl-Q(34) synthetase GluQRS [Pseudoflavonifractor phocaeensis]MCF2662891.1 tRNA glutamyl-Q(34) synthetase GluQRS [Pseudoflavonifractor phocaeensis]